jgi:hypothetical protein
MASFSLAEEAKSKSLSRRLNAEEFGFCDGLSHQFRLVEWY